MLNYIWLGMILVATVIGLINGKTTAVVESITSSATVAFTIALGLTGILTFWLGLMKIAEESGLVYHLTRFIRPLMIRLFPEVPHEHPAMGAMMLNITANMLGLNNAATPFGLKAMEDLEKLNQTPGTATNAMCTFLAINTSSVQLIPTTAIAFLAAAGAIAPTQVIASSLLASICSTIAAIIAVKGLEKISFFRINPPIKEEC